MSDGKIRFHEALAHRAERDGNYAEMHTQFQQAEYYKQERNHGMETKRGKIEAQGGVQKTRRNPYRIRNPKEPIGD